MDTLGSIPRRIRGQMVGSKGLGRGLGYGVHTGHLPNRIPHNPAVAMRARFLLALLPLVVAPLAAQEHDSLLVGTWTTQTMAMNRETGQRVMLEAQITFAREGAFRSHLHSLDASGPSTLPETHGDWLTLSDHNGHNLICVRNEKVPAEVHCQQYYFQPNGDLHWGDLDFTAQKPTPVPGQQS